MAFGEHPTDPIDPPILGLDSGGRSQNWPLNPASVQELGPWLPTGVCWQESFKKELFDGNNVCYVLLAFQFGYMVSKF